MDIADFILQLEADLKSEANVTDQETSDQEKMSKQLDSDKSYRAKGKKPKNGSLKDKSEDDLVDLEELEPEDQPEEEQASSEDDDVPMEIDLSKSDSWTDTKSAFNRLRAGESQKVTKKLKLIGIDFQEARR